MAGNCRLCSFCMNSLFCTLMSFTTVKNLLIELFIGLFNRAFILPASKYYPYIHRGYILITDINIFIARGRDEKVVKHPT